MRKTAETRALPFSVDLARDFTPVHSYEHYRLLSLEIDVVKAWKLVCGWSPSVRKNRLAVIPIPKGSLDLHILDTKKAMAADLTVPVLVGQFQTMQPLMIDGWHRAWKAHRQKQKELPAFLLTVKETAACRLDRGPR